ncbi:MAG: protein kinase [Planctomycetes bacterium]|nr:protein kinase [Planctomycetota bacterium]MCW8136598.1 protein kinase [Planctomycetota bacterium]
MSDRHKSIVAAILAVHSGRISPDEAAAMLEDPGKVSSLTDFDGDVPTVTLSGLEGVHELPIIDVLENPAMQRKALADIGIGEDAQQTLFNFGRNGGETDMRVIRDTLRAVATTGRDLAGSDVKPASRPDADTESPTQGPRKNTTLRITTGRFMENFGIQSDRYEVKKEHARGGMGRVLLARDKAVGRDVALKELLPGMAGSSIPASVPAGVSESGGIIERFLREARITGQLEHPNIVPVYEIGQYPDGQYYYTMRFIRGRTLADKLREIRKDESLDKEQKLAARIKLLDQFIDVCHAIAYAHSKGVIHRDIKPENIMLGDYGETLVLDWGLARLKGHEDKAMKALQKGSLALSKSLLDSDSQALTLDGSIVGTPAYMAPEQARGELEHVDEKSDVYALGAVLYQILTGHPPFEGPMAALIVQQVLAGPPVRVRTREPKVPPELEALTERAMARDKAQRLGSALELAGEVKAFRDGRTLGSYDYSTSEMVLRFVRQHRTTVSIGVLAFLLLVAGAIFFTQNLAKERDSAQAAQKQAEDGKRIAEDALTLATAERAERERLEREKREREAAEFKLRLREAEQMLGTIEGMRIEPALQDLEQRLSRYDAELVGPPARKLLELSADEQVGNGVLLSNLLGYISARQSLLDLLDGPAGAEMPEAFRHLDLAQGRNDLNELRLGTARLARINGDFTLAEFLIAGSSLPAATIRRERAEIDVMRESLLALHARRIDEALFDVRSGIGRAGRDPGAPTLDEYARRLSLYREAQTVDLLAKELERLGARPAPEWSRSDVHAAQLACRVLGKLEQPSRVVPLLARFLDRVSTPEAVAVVGEALGFTASPDAADVLLLNLRKRGIDYAATVLHALARLPLPSRLRAPQGAGDWIDLGWMRRAKGDHVGAAEAATRALNLSEGSVEALLLRGLSHADADRRQEALADFERALAKDSDAYDVLIARANARNVYMDGEAVIADLTRAIALRETDPRAYVHRARIYFTRARVEEARRDYLRIVELEPRNIEYRLMLGDFLRGLGRAGFADAEIEYSRVVEQAPDDWRGWSARCVLRRDTNFSGCISDGIEATRLNPKAARAWNFMSQSYYGLGRLAEGIEAATRSVEADPTEWLAFYYRGILYLKRQDQEDRANVAANVSGSDASNAEEVRRLTLERAIADFRAVVTLNPQDFRSFALMAMTLVELGRYEEARHACVRGLELAPFDGQGPTIGMGTLGVRQALLEIEGAALAGREPEQPSQMIALAHYHMRNASRPRNLAKDGREAMRWLAAARRKLGAGAEPVVMYQLATAESRLVMLLLGADRPFDAEASGRARLGDTQFVFPEDHYRHALALAGMAAAYTAARMHLIGASPESATEAIAAFNAMSIEQRRARVEQLHNQVIDALFAAAAAGYRDQRQAEREPLFLPLHSHERWPQLLEAIANSTATPPADPGAGTQVVVLSFVNEEGPAWAAGLRTNDVVFEVNGVKVQDAMEMITQLRAVAAGAEYTMKVRRYLLQNGRLVPQTGADGKPILDEAGLPVWRSTEHEIKLKQGYLGLRPDNCTLPSPLYP